MSRASQSESTHRPTIVVTMGDPAGVGPEVIAKAWGSPKVHAACRPFVVGHPEILRRAARLTAPDVAVLPLADWEDAEPTPQRMPCLWWDDDRAVEVLPGALDRRAGAAAYQAIIRGLEQLQAGHAEGLVTAPISKAALHAAGHEVPGHTELLAQQCGVNKYAMALHLPREAHPASAPLGLTIVHVTLHTALRRVWDELTSENIADKISLAYDFCQKLQCALPDAPQPRLAVAALNPHAGEEGLFGDEEARILRPAVERASAEGIPVQGPFPADTLMARAMSGGFDAVVAMYHDQGHIAMKLAAMHHAVNVTLGLPIVRTSVAHGTAFDIAWQGRADSRGMVHAIVTCARLLAARSARLASQ